MSAPSSRPLNTTRHIGRGAFSRAPAAALLALLALLLAGTAAAAPSVPSKHISTTGNLGFGRFVAAGGGAVSVSPTGVRGRSGSVVLLNSSASAASFSIISPHNDNKVYVLTLPANGSVSLSSGVNQMVLSSFVSSAPAGAPLPTATERITVGATLQVSPNQPPGAYSGTFNVTLEYQ